MIWLRKYGLVLKAALFAIPVALAAWFRLQQSAAEAELAERDIRAARKREQAARNAQDAQAGAREQGQDDIQEAVDNAKDTTNPRNHFES